jgi:serine/threonine protein kinase
MQKTRSRRPFPDEISKFPSLSLLRLNYFKINSTLNQIAETLKTSSGLSQGLTTFDLSSNEVAGPIPRILLTEVLSSVWEISLNSNKLTGSIPAAFGDLTNLIGLALNQNDLSGTIPPELFETSKIKFFGVTSNRLTGLLPSSLFDSTAIDLLSVSNNSLQGEIPKAPEHNKPSLIELSSNNFSGTFPYAHFRNLQHLDLSNNMFVGNVSEMVPALQLLHHLNLSNNQYGGHHPSVLPIKLKVLDMRACGLSGTIPSDAFSANATPLLRFVSLGTNALSGTIPASLMSLPLVGLDLTKNRLSGVVPKANNAAPFLAENCRYQPELVAEDFDQVWWNQPCCSLSGNEFCCPEGPDTDQPRRVMKTCGILQCSTIANNPACPPTPAPTRSPTPTPTPPKAGSRTAVVVIIGIGAALLLGVLASFTARRVGSKGSKDGEEHMLKGLLDEHSSGSALFSVNDVGGTHIHRRTSLRQSAVGGGTTQPMSLDLDSAELLSTVGEGQHWEVSRARWRGSIVAAKTLKLQPRSISTDSTNSSLDKFAGSGSSIDSQLEASTEALFKDIRREVRLLSRIHHHNVVSFIGCGCHELGVPAANEQYEVGQRKAKSIVVFVEWVEGGPLLELIGTFAECLRAVGAINVDGQSVLSSSTIPSFAHDGDQNGDDGNESLGSARRVMQQLFKVWEAGKRLQSEVSDVAAVHARDTAKAAGTPQNQGHVQGYRDLVLEISTDDLQSAEMSEANLSAHEATEAAHRDTRAFGAPAAGGGGAPAAARGGARVKSGGVGVATGEGIEEEHTYSQWREAVGKWAIHMAMQIANGLAHLHQHDIVHLQLKPTNVLVDCKWTNAKIADYGLHSVALVKEKTGTSSAYGAPELQWGGGRARHSRALSGSPASSTSSTVSQAAEMQTKADNMAGDVYSLGLVMWHLFTGKTDLVMQSRSHRTVVASPVTSVVASPVTSVAASPVTSPTDQSVPPSAVPTELVMQSRKTGWQSAPSPTAPRTASSMSFSSENGSDVSGGSSLSGVGKGKRMRPALPAEMPLRLQRLLSRCWNKDPRQRPTCKEVVTELAECSL